MCKLSATGSSIVLCLVLVSCTTGGQEDDLGALSRAASSVYRSASSGGGSSASFGDQLAGGSIDVWESGSSAGLYYSVYAVDPSSEVCYTDSYPCPEGTCTSEWCYYTRYTYEYGWGAIPASDYRVNNGTAALDTVTGGDDFSAWRCNFDDNDWNGSTCGPGEGGAIRISWRRDGVSSSFHSGVEQTTSGKYSMKTTGQYRSFSADASGDILGLAFANAAGQMNTFRGSTVQKDVVAAPHP